MFGSSPMPIFVSQNGPMKRYFALLLIVVAGLTAACTKSSDDPQPPAGSNFTFSSLQASDTIVKVNGLITLTADAAGEGLAYKWSATYGTFVGSGATVQWTVCHKATFTITCQVTDKYNHSESKSVVVHAVN